MLPFRLDFSKFKLCIPISAHFSLFLDFYSHFGTISFYKLLTNFNIMQIIFLSEIIFLALVQINGKVLADFRNLFTEISAARMNYKKICSVR